MSALKIIIPVIIIVIAAIIGIKTMHRNDLRPAITSQPTAAIRYLPLGDSYTIGESVNEADRWPNQLVARLQQTGTSIAITANPSVTGYTTQNLIDKELPLMARLRPNFVTIQIGVNDYVQGVDVATFQQHLSYILDQVQRQLPNNKQVVLVTIPDYGLTPTGSRFGDPVQSEQGIVAFNKIISTAAQDRGLGLADVFPASQKVSTDASLIANDGLHPSGAQYSLWTDAIYPVVQTTLRQ